MISIGRRDCRPLSLRHAADLLQAMGHPIRLQILHALRPGALTVNDIVAQLGLQQPVVSRHLAVLRAEGVVSAQARGRQRSYQLAGCRMEPLLEVLFDDVKLSQDPTPRTQGTAA